MPDERLPHRTLKTSFWLAVFCTLVFAARAQMATAYGFAVGAALGLFSLATLIYVVPRLFTQGNVSAKAGMWVVALVKLPIFALVIYFALSAKFVSAFAVMAGVALVPAVLSFKVLGYQMLVKDREPAGGK